MLFPHLFPALPKMILLAVINTLTETVVSSLQGFCFSLASAYIVYTLLLYLQDAYIQERADAMENIHSTIVELGTIFRQLAEMVQEQEEQVAR